MYFNPIYDEVVSVMASSAVDGVFEPRPGEATTVKLVFIASLQSKQH